MFSLQLSISEYRKRKQQSTGTPPEQETTGDSSNQQEKSRERSGSASSGTSSLSSDDEGAKAAQDLPGLSTLPLFANLENSDEKKGELKNLGENGASEIVETNIVVTVDLIPLLSLRY